MSDHPTILVTGATGLLGSHLLVHLCKSFSGGNTESSGARIIGMKRDSSDLEKVRKVFSYYPDIDNTLFNKIEWRTGDVLNKESLKNALNGVSQVYHCAAIVSFDPKDREDLIKNNVKGTKNLIEALKELPGILSPNSSTKPTVPDLSEDDSPGITTASRRRHEGVSPASRWRQPGVTRAPALIHVSSTSALGDSIASDPSTIINERTKRDPHRSHSGYSVSKYESEKIVQKAIDEGLNAAIVNPGIILGPGFWNKGSSMLFTKVWQGLKFYTKGSTGYVDVRDVAKIMIRLGSEVRGPQSGVQSPKSEVRGPDSRFPNPDSRPDAIGDSRFCLVGFNASFKNFFFSVADHLHKPRPSILAGRFLSGLAWRVDTLRARISRSYPLITRETAESANRVSIYSSALADEYGFIGMDESVSWVSECFLRDHENKPGMKEIDKRICDFLHDHHVATLATTVNNEPWVAHCFYVFLEKEQIIVFTTDEDTRHGSEMKENSKVALGIALETKTIGKIRGVQIEGEAINLQTEKNELLKAAKKAYLKRFPYAALVKTTLWAVMLETIKMTDNRLGFGKKVRWGKT